MENFFPVGSKRTFLPRQNGGDSEATSAPHGRENSWRHTRDGLVGEERLLMELREMRRQIQLSCAEEISVQMERLLREIKRELQGFSEGVAKADGHEMSMEDYWRQSKFISSAEVIQSGELCRQAAAQVANGGGSVLVKRAEEEKKRARFKASLSYGNNLAVSAIATPPTRPPGFPEEKDVQGGAAAALQPQLQEKEKEKRKGFKPAFLRSGSLVNEVLERASMSSSRSKSEERRSGLPGSQQVVTDPRCPIAPDQIPAMVPMEGEPPPHPPMLDMPTGDAAAGGGQEWRPSNASRTTPMERLSNLSPTSAAAEDEAGGEQSGRRKLSLSVDVCRRQAKAKPQAKPVWMMSAHDFLNSTRFDNLIGSLILMNALTIGIQTDYAAKNLTEEFPDTFMVVERFFLVCFACELLLRIYVQKIKFFCDRKNFMWNYFDFTIVMTQGLEEVLLLVSAQGSSGDSGGGSGMDADQFRLLRILRILRIVRILRVVRVLHLISELRTIVSSIMGSFKSLGWTVVLLLLMIYIVSVYFTQAISDHLIQLGGNPAIFGDKDQELHYYFGSLSRTILSLWQAMSGGADWDAMAGPLITQVGVLQGLMFAGYIAFALLALMNVVTGVFVQTALQSAKDEEDAFLVDQVLKLFDRAGDEDTATITLEQIEERLSDPELGAEWKSINVQPAEAQYLFSLLDIEEKGEISFQEFLSGCLRLHGPSKSMDVLTVMQESRSAARAWRLSNKRNEEFQLNLQIMLEGMANAVAAVTKLAARVSLSVESSIDLANQHQDKLARLEKQVRRFEATLCSVRIAASNMNKVNDFIDTLTGPVAPNRSDELSGEEIITRMVDEV